MRRLVVVIAVAACSTPYQPMGARGGVEAVALGQGRWLITASGNGFTSRSTVVRYTYRRAAELCRFGFTPVDADRSSSEHVATFDGGKSYQTYSKPDAMLVVQCHAPPPPPPKRRGPPGGP